MTDSTPPPAMGPLAAMPTPETPETAHTAPEPSRPPSFPEPGHTTPPAPSVPVVAATTPTPPPQQQEREAPIDPRVTELRAMFPDYDDLILQSVLESVQLDQGRAIDVLLGMSDPDYRAEPTPAPTQQSAMSQTELDEQFARQLLLEEEHQQQLAWQAAQRAHGHQQRPQQQQRPGGQPVEQQQGGDTMAELQQQFTKVAEAGKKTFGNIFAKVKTKIQEMDQQRQGQGSASSTAAAAGGAPQWNAGSNDGYDPTRYEQQVSQSHQTSQVPQPRYATRPPRRQTTPQPQTQSSDPDNNGHHGFVTFADQQPSSQAKPEVKGYDTTPEHAKESNSISAVSTTGAAGLSTSPPKTIDAGKYGLLPKRPVSLLSPGASSATPLQRHDSQDDSDGLEYTENPFEENKK